MDAPKPKRRVKLHDRGGVKETLFKGDTIFTNGPCRVTIKKTGANGGGVRVVATPDGGTKVKFVKQRRKAIRREP